jgi:hypothetical protein
MQQTWKIIVAIIITAVIVGGGVYFWQNSKQQSSVTPSPETKQEKTPTEPVSNQGQDETSIYGFSLVVPTNWGTVLEKVENGPSGSKIYKTVRLTAENDFERYIQIQIVKTGDKNDPSVIDYPQTYLTGNSTYNYYYSGGGDYAGSPDMEDQKYFDIQKEVKGISETFKML